MSIAKKSEWVAALRSENYGQGREHLFNNGKYCCLGVYCEILGIEKTETKSEMFYKISNIVIRLSEFGLDERTVKILIDMNDSDRRSFAEIADWIEANL